MTLSAAHRLEDVRVLAALLRANGACDARSARPVLRHEARNVRWFFWVVVALLDSDSSHERRLELSLSPAASCRVIGYLASRVKSAVACRDASP